MCVLFSSTGHEVEMCVLARRELMCVLFSSTGHEVEMCVCVCVVRLSAEQL